MTFRLYILNKSVQNKRRASFSTVFLHNLERKFYRFEGRLALTICSAGFSRSKERLVQNVAALLRVPDALLFVFFGGKVSLTT